MEGSVIERKLDEAVDREIAARDPKFAADLKASNPDPSKRWGPAAPGSYINQKRVEWWSARIAKMSVVLNDLQLYTACHLTAMGVRSRPNNCRNPPSDGAPPCSAIPSIQ